MIAEPTRGRRRPAALAGMAVAVANLIAALALPETASAHATLVGVEDIPLPTLPAIGGAAAVLVVSFIALAVGWERPLLEHERWRALPTAVSRTFLNPGVELVCGAFGVFLLGLTIYAGLEGTVAPDRNFAVTFTFVTFWLGLVVVSIVFGDVFRAFNPWRAIARVVGGVFRLAAGQSAPAPLAYPERLGRWPAAIGVLLFVWLELVWGQGLTSLSVTPHDTAIAALVYSAYTFVMMALFGVERWLDRGEMFSVYFGMFARASVFEVREGRLGRRRFLSGLSDWADGPGAVALVLIIIGVTAFDGGSETVLQSPIASIRDWLDPALGPSWAARLASSLAMAFCVGLIAAIYWTGVVGMRTVEPSHSTAELGRRFVHSFVPIALAYLIAHYFSYFVFLEQAQFGFLLSDPLGEGADIFGTASNGIDYSVIGSRLVWWVQIGSLVIGHVVALALGHDKALVVFRNVLTAVRSQYWMLGLMVGFTSLGIWLLSLGNT